MKLIKWNNDFISGVDIVDFQHKILVRTLYIYKRRRKM